MPKVVEVPGVGNVEFPDNVSDDQISRTIRLHQPEPAAKGSGDWLKWSKARATDVLEEAHARDPKVDDKGFLHGLWNAVNPIPLAQAVIQGPDAIGRVVEGAFNAQTGQTQQANDAFKKGDYLSAAGHALAAAVPLIGPMAAHAGDAIGDGKTGEGLGEAAGLLGGAVVPHAVKTYIKPRVLPLVAKATEALKGTPAAALEKMNGVSPRPLSPEAVDMAERLNVPLSAGARSGSKFTQAAEKILGSTVAPDLYEAHTAAGAEGIQQGVSQLANNFATDKYAAGESTVKGLREHSGKHGADAQAAYLEMQQHEADPAHQVEVVQGTKTVRTPASNLLDAQGNPTTPAGVKEVPILETIGLPVDTTPARAMLEPIRKNMMEQYPIARQQADPALHAIQQVLSGPKYVPASTAENFLSAAKKMQREAVGTNKLLIGRAIDAMSPAVDEAVSRAGKGAVETLHQGRESWRQHMDTEGLIEDLAGDTSGKSGQVDAARTLLRPADAAFPQLERVLAKTPAAAEPLRQALLGDVFKKAETGEFTNPTQAANLFNHIGKRTQAALFTPEQLADTRATLELAQRLAENPNPSGSGLIGAMVKMGVMVTHPITGGATLALGRKFAKALYSPDGAKNLRAALSGGPGAPAALAKVAESIKDPAMLTATDEYGDTVSQPAAGVHVDPEEPQGGGMTVEEWEKAQDAPASNRTPIKPHGSLFPPAKPAAAPAAEPEAPAAAPAAAPEPKAPAPEPAAPETDLFGNPIEAAPQPGDVKQMHPSDILADPVRFQYKANTGGAAGVGDELKSVNNYDPELGGVLSVWTDPANGKTYVVNGHHRLELAKRAGAPAVTVRYLDAADANAARTKGAIINIAEGRGTAIDAAKVFRDTGMGPEELGKKGVSLTGAKARDGMNLAKLAPAIFDKVVQGDLPTERAAMIGEVLPEHADQHAALELIERAEATGKHVTNDQFRELVQFVKAAPKKMSAADENYNLFGDAAPAEESTALEMAAVSDFVRKKLAGEKKLFGLVSDAGKSKALEAAGNALTTDKNAAIAQGAGQHLEVYDKLKTSAGDVHNVLRSAAESLGKKGAPANEIKAHAYERIREAIRKTLGEGSK